MTPKQLPLTSSPPRRTIELHRMIQVLPKHEKDAHKRGHAALKVFTDRFEYRPREIICHPLDGAEIGPEVDGIPVITAGLTRFMYWVGPLEG